MSAARIAAVLVLFATSGCDELVPTPERAAVDYRPELAGTVDHAMCLLGFTAVALRTLSTGHHLVDGNLNGRDATFVLDTGANLSVVNASVADDFGLSPQPGVIGGAMGLGGAMSATRSRIDALRIGAVDIRQSHIMGADLSQVEGVLGRISGTPIHGIIGQDVMTEHRAVIDVARPMLYLQQEASAPAPVPADQCRDANDGPSA